MNLLQNSINFVLDKLYSFISYVNFGDTLNYYAKDFSDNSIAITYNKNTKLYGLCLEGYSNIENKFKISEIQIGGKVLVSIVKNNNINKIFIFSDDKLLMSNIANKFDIKLLNPDELISAIYSIFLIETYNIKEKRAKNHYTKEEQKFLDDDPLHIIFSQMIKNATYNILKNYQPYQATIFGKSDNYSIFELLNAQWEGVLFFLIEFSQKEVLNHINSLKSQAKLTDSSFMKNFNDLNKAENQDALKELLNQTAVINSIAIIKDKIGINKIENTINMKFEPRYLSMDKIISKTLFRARDRDFDFLIPRTWASQLISTTIQKDGYELIKHKNDVFKKMDFCGKDIQEGFINYTFKQSANPHALVFGTTGIGKSVSVLNIMCQIIDFDFESKKARSLDKFRKIRYANVGFSGGRIFEAIQTQSQEENSNLIQKMDSNIGNLRFSLFDFEKDIPDEDEFKSLVGFFNLILAFENHSNTTPLTNVEEMILKECVIYVCKDKIENPTTKTLAELMHNTEDDYKVFIDEILNIKDENGNQKYTPYETKLGELDDKYKRFKKPILADVISRLESIKNDINKSEGEIKAISTLKDKLSLFTQNKIFSLYSNVDLKDNTPMYYAEFDKIKNHKKDFVAIAWLLITCWFKADKEKALERMNANLPKPDSYYIIDEAHNFLKHEVFLDLLNVYAREMRKFGCHLILITQEPQDINQILANFFATKFYIFLENNKQAMYQGIKFLNGDKDLEEKDKRIFDLIDNSVDKNRTIFMQHSGGTSAIKLPEYKGYENYFTSYDF